MLNTQPSTQCSKSTMLLLSFLWRYNSYRRSLTKENRIRLKQKLHWNLHSFNEFVFRQKIMLRTMALPHLVICLAVTETRPGDNIKQFKRYTEAPTGRLWLKGRDTIIKITDNKPLMLVEPMQPVPVWFKVIQTLTILPSTSTHVRRIHQLWLGVLTRRTNNQGNHSSLTSSI